MDASPRLAFWISVALMLPGTLHAEQSRTSPGYYYYPQQSYYMPYGYQRPQTPAPSASSDVEPAASGTPVIEADIPDRYPRVGSAELSPVAATFRIEQTRLGAVLADHEGRTLYVSTQEAADATDCGADCAHLWQPLLGDEGVAPVKPFGLIERVDGSRQWTYSDRPLYRWKGDRNEGDVTADGLDGTWFVLRVRAP